MAFEKGARIVMPLMVMQRGWGMALRWVQLDYQMEW